MKDMSDGKHTFEETPHATPAEEKQPASAAHDGIDRRNFLSCMAWAGTGLLWTMAGGVPTSRLFAATAAGGGSAAHAHSGSSFSEKGIDDALRRMHPLFTRKSPLETHRRSKRRFIGWNRNWFTR